MGRKALVYGAGLIAVYLVVNNATNAGKLITAGASGSTSVVKTLQGR